MWVVAVWRRVCALTAPVGTPLTFTFAPHTHRNAMLAAALAYGNPAANITADSAAAVMAGLEAVLNRIVAAEGGKERFAAQYRRWVRGWAIHGA